MKGLRYVLDRDGKERGEVRSKSRRCQLEGCRGTRIGVRWPDGHTTYPCSRGMKVITPDTWQII